MTAYGVLAASPTPLPACVIAQRLQADLVDVYAELVALEACDAVRVVAVTCPDGWTVCRWEAMARGAAC